MNRQTLEMLNRVQRLGISLDDALALRRVSMTLHRWHELECGDSNAYASWSIARGEKNPNGSFYYNDNGKPYIERHYYPQMVGQPGNRTTYSRIPDRERGAQRRLAKIMAKYPTLSAYIQTDPRGAALYILKPSDFPPGGGDVSAYYSRGVAVYK